MVQTSKVTIMSDATNQLDRFFFGFDDRPEPVSNCCAAPVLGETYKGFGRCSQCLEMAEFKEETE